MLDLSPEQLIIAAILIPLAVAALLPVFHRVPNLREAVTLAGTVALLSTTIRLAGHVFEGARPGVFDFDIGYGLTFGFKVEPLGMMFALVASTLWIANSVYSIGYMRGNNEPRQTMFYVCFAVALSSTIALAFSKNLFTLFLFYEILTLSTFPLVAHKANADALRGARIYIMLLLATSMVLLLPAIAWTWNLAGTTDFKLGGIYPASIDTTTLTILVVLFAFGIGKAALMPFHFWLPSAMVAPTPVSALLHAVAVVKAGVFTVTKVFVYIFGIDTLAQTGASDWLVYFASFCLLAASVIAITKTNLKARLAYSTVSQLAYVVLGAALATQTAIIGAGVHIVMHAVAKITLFFCAGAIYTVAHKTEIHELDGIGRKMPLTMAAFVIGSLSIIGLPPFGGAWSKWWLMIGALDAGKQFVVAVLMLSSLLNVWYLLSIPIRAFFTPEHKTVSVSAAAAAGNDLPNGLERRHPLVVIAPCVTAAGCLALFFYADAIVALLQPIVPK
ncbi:MAG: hypothetical protein RLZ98_2893 [Pseudomonadota bacterium]|jgi:multicomponent Na+:H+ antiporter subunit D